MYGELLLEWLSKSCNQELHSLLVTHQDKFISVIHTFMFSL